MDDSNIKLSWSEIDLIRGYIEAETVQLTDARRIEPNPRKQDQIDVKLDRLSILRRKLY